MTSSLYTWIHGIFTKVVVGVNSEQELKDIYYAAQDMDLPCCIIKDVGKTEFDGIPTYTAVAIGPCDAALVDKVTGHLQLL